MKYWNNYGYALNVCRQFFEYLNVAIIVIEQIIGTNIIYNNNLKVLKCLNSRHN